MLKLPDCPYENQNYDNFLSARQRKMLKKQCESYHEEYSCRMHTKTFPTRLERTRHMLGCVFHRVCPRCYKVYTTDAQDLERLRDHLRDCRG